MNVNFEGQTVKLKFFFEDLLNSEYHGSGEFFLWAESKLQKNIRLKLFGFQWDEISSFDGLICVWYAHLGKQIHRIE